MPFAFQTDNSLFRWFALSVSDLDTVISFFLICTQITRFKTIILYLIIMNNNQSEFYFILYRWQRLHSCPSVIASSCVSELLLWKDILSCIFQRSFGTRRPVSTKRCRYICTWRLNLNKQKSCQIGGLNHQFAADLYQKSQFPTHCLHYVITTEEDHWLFTVK